MDDRITKQKMNIILLVDTSKSMAGKRIKQVNTAINDIKEYLIDLQNENSNIDFYISIIQFSNDARFYNEKKCININDLNYKDIKCGGYSNLHFAYEELGKIIKKESKGGIMPDFGGATPIILLLTDGHPTSNKYIEELDKIKKEPWFKVALRYGIAIELNDDKTRNVLSNFVGDNGEIIDCYKSEMLKNIIEIIVLTASKVQSTSSNVVINNNTNTSNNVKQQITDALSDIESWEW